MTIKDFFKKYDFELVPKLYKKLYGTVLSETVQNQVETGLFYHPLNNNIQSLNIDQTTYIIVSELFKYENISENQLSISDLLTQKTIQNQNAKINQNTDSSGFTKDYQNNQIQESDNWNNNQFLDTSQQTNNSNSTTQNNEIANSTETTSNVAINYDVIIANISLNSEKLNKILFSILSQLSFPISASSKSGNYWHY